MLAPAILVFERHARREVGLKREFAGTPWLVRPCRTIATVFEWLTAHPGSLIVASLESHDSPQALIAAVMDSPAAPVIYLIGEAAESTEWALRELGVRACWPPDVPDAQIARECRWQLTNHGATHADTQN